MQERPAVDFNDKEYIRNRQKGRFSSTKHEGAGIGLESVNKVVEKYQGVMKVEYDKTYFTVCVMLNAQTEP